MSNELNRSQDQEKTQDTNSSELVEDAQIIHEKNIPEQMDEIIKNNDKFETVKVLMEILCKELMIPVDSGFPTIAGALNRVWEAYFKSMEEWKIIAKQGQKTSIRQ